MDQNKQNYLGHKNASKNFQGDTLLAYFSGKGPFGCSFTHDEHQILTAMLQTQLWTQHKCKQEYSLI